MTRLAPLRRTELAAGQYEVTVMGYALQSEYQLTVQLVEPVRELRPLETLALGQVRGSHARAHALQSGVATLTGPALVAHQATCAYMLPPVTSCDAMQCSRRPAP